jgi:hypothetical protein
MSTEGQGPNLISSLFVSKGAYKRIADDFHPYHRHDLNVFLHLLTTTLGVWGAIQLAMVYSMDYLVVVYAAFIFLTTPLLTGLIHTVAVAAMVLLTPTSSVSIAVSTIVAGYGLQDLAHYLTGEATFMSSYIFKKPLLLVLHSIWLLPLVIDSVIMREFFLPWFVSRNRNVTCTVVNKKSVEGLRSYIKENVPETKETIHIWPHKQSATTTFTKEIEDDAAIYEAFRRVFAARHFDIKPVISMNEIYVTAVGAKKEINSDAVFYTPHTDGPYWWLPGASLYRVLVGITPNAMVRTRFNLQHESIDKVIDIHEVLGFDYNRELHWIDHTNKTNTERRSLLKLHYIVYPKGWHRYGDFCASLNSKYNTWARSNFLATLRPETMYEIAMAWWIWLTTWSNAYFNIYFGWNNLVYFLAAYAMGPQAFLIMTSFRHYIIYITTFGFRKPPVAYGEFMRDCKIYKTMALFHLAKMMYPKIDISMSSSSIPHDLLPIILSLAGFGVTLLATYRLGYVRTYFGSELGFVKPKWIEGFPYGYIPHPMIVGQLFAFANILFWWGSQMEPSEKALVGGHMYFYTVHMIQEIFYSDY